MNLEIRPMGPEDYDQKGYVHWKSWQETYTGLMDSNFLANQSLEKCRDMARRWPGNTLVAELDGRIVGFSCYIRHDDRHGEVSAIYLLREAQGLGIGRKLMDAAFSRLTDLNLIDLWVLKGNHHAIGFYEHYGFRSDGTEAPIKLGTPNMQLRMIYHR